MLTKEEITTYWDKGHRGMPADKEHSVYAEEIEKLISKSSLVADLGSGTGADSIFFLHKGHSVIALDISPEALALVREKAQKLNLDEKLETEQIDLEEGNLPLDDNSIDVVYARLSLHYFDKQRTEVVLKNLVSKLRKDGQAFITLKSSDDEKEMEYLRKTAQEIEENLFIDEGMINSRFTREQLQEIVQDIDAEVIEVSSYVEDLSMKVDKTKSGNKVLLLNQIYIKK